LGYVVRSHFFLELLQVFTRVKTLVCNIDSSQFGAKPLLILLFSFVSFRATIQPMLIVAHFKCLHSNEYQIKRVQDSMSIRISATLNLFDHDICIKNVTDLDLLRTGAFRNLDMSKVGSQMPRLADIIYHLQLKLKIETICSQAANYLL